MLSSAVSKVAGLRRHALGRTLSSTTEALTPSKQHSLYPKLFTPLDLGPAGVLPNRLVMGSMHTGLEGHSLPSLMERLINGGVNEEHTLDRMAAYFKRRAEGGIGMLVTGGVSPNPEGWLGPFSGQLTNHDEMLVHKVVTDAVHSVQVPIYGTDESVASKICMQILHTGRYANHAMAVSSSPTHSPISPHRAKELDSAGIQSTIRDFINCAVLAQEAGYDGVEIMGSEGYLITQFLSPATNQRTDDYGGSFANRSRLPLEIVQAVREACGPEFIIIFRISLWDLVEGGMSWEEALELAANLEKAGVTILNAGIGWHQARVPTIATSVPRGAFTHCTKMLKDANVVSIPVVATNRINAPDTAESILADNTSDMVSMARPLLADPDFLKKAREEQAPLINTCIGCNQACLDHIFVGKTASCLVNPLACHETLLEPRLLPEEQRLSISIVGAGPAGCGFAVTAAQMGHKVTLYDESDKVGGQFHMAKRIPGKEEFHEALRYFENQLEALGVDVRLNTSISHQDMADQKDVDKWIVATGVSPRDPKIPGGDHPNVLSYIDVLRDNKPVGKKVAVIGAGGIGFDVSEFLLYHEKDKTHKDVSIQEFWDEWGIDPEQKEPGGLKKPVHKPPQREVHLMQRKKSKVGGGLGKSTGWIHRATLKMGNVNMVNGVTYDKVDEDGNLHYTRDGKQRVLEVDNIVLCAGQVEYKELEDQAKETEIAGNVYTIGGAWKAGELDAKRAIDMGTRLALKIHEEGVTPGNHVFQSTPSVEEKMYNALRF